MAKYQLLKEHYIGVALMPAGTEIDTADPAFKDFVPSMYTAPLDAAGEKAIDEVAKRRKLRPAKPVEVGFAMNGDIPADDPRVNQAGGPAMGYSVSTPGLSAVGPEAAEHTVPRVGDMQVASDSGRLERERDRTEREDNPAKAPPSAPEHAGPRGNPAKK